MTKAKYPRAANVRFIAERFARVASTLPEPALAAEAVAYVNYGLLPNPLLVQVFQNNLYSAVQEGLTQADLQMAKDLLTVCPQGAWGSAQDVALWHSIGGLVGIFGSEGLQEEQAHD